MKFNIKVPRQYPTVYSMWFSASDIVKILEDHIKANGVEIPVDARGRRIHGLEQYERHCSPRPEMGVLIEYYVGGDDDDE